MNHRQIINKIPPPIRKLFQLQRFMVRGQFKTMWGGGTFRQNYKSAIERYNAGKTSYSLFKDMVACYLEYGATPQEYFAFGFDKSTNDRRSTFLTNKHKDQAVIKVIGISNRQKYLEDKFNFYQLLHHFFYRDVCRLSCEQDESDFERFCSLHNRFIAKPLNGQCGNGVKIVETQPDVHSLFTKLLSEGPYIVEELIVQSKTMSQWNESSVNTVRLPAFLNSSGFHILKPFFRMGRRGAIVDNGAQGGVFAIIDERSGKLVSDGYDESGNCYIYHPDSHLPIKDFQLPEWDSLLMIAEKCARLMPKPVARYIGWDFAHTANGWVLIEGNWGQFLSEFVDQEGIKEKFDKYMNE